MNYQPLSFFSAPSALPNFLIPLDAVSTKIKKAVAEYNSVAAFSQAQQHQSLTSVAVQELKKGPSVNNRAYLDSRYDRSLLKRRFEQCDCLDDDFYCDTTTTAQHPNQQKKEASVRLIKLDSAVSGSYLYSHNQAKATRPYVHDF